MAASFPKNDLPTDIFSHDLDLYLQAPDVFDHAHAVTEQSSYLFAVAHRALDIGASTLEVKSVEAAISQGAAAYEIIAAVAEPSKNYDDNESKMKVFYGTKRFLDDITSSDDLLRKLEVAGDHMAYDTPHLNEIITDIISPRVDYDTVAIQFALRGAAAMRAMQIYVDQGLEITN